MPYLRSVTLITSSALAVTMAACKPAPNQPNTTSQLLSQQQTGFSQVVPGHQLQFPADHLAHDDFRVEWWYLTANLTNQDGLPLGLQWTQFRIALSADEVNQTNQQPSWQTNQLYMAHAAVTSSTRHFSTEKWSRAHPELATISPNPLTIKLDNWQWQSQGEQLFPAQLTVNSPNFDYSLQLDSKAPLQQQGENGYSIKAADGSVASYYYSQPFINIQGEITLDGIQHSVTGDAWLDREWSSQLLTRHQQGWDWFAIRLDDGSALMLFQLRGDTHFYSARRMFEDGSGESIAAEDISMQVQQWQETKQGRYPVSWLINIDKHDIELVITALNNNAAMALTTHYWEGPISVSGTHQGVGYMELTGYDNEQ